MLLLQNGLNNITGDPTLDDEKAFQLDWAWQLETRSTRLGCRAFHQWALDYITFENTQVVRVPPDGDVAQTNLRYVNTDLATFTGFEAFGEALPDSMLTPYFTMNYVDGRDRSRDGGFATSNGSAGNASEKIFGTIRGAFSGVVGSDAEPLPGISPLETRIGLRFHDTSPERLWAVDVESRIVAAQNRVATSLLETTTPGFTIWNVRGIFKLTESLNLTTGIENFTDRQYREHLDFRTQSGLAVYQPGFNFYVGAAATY
ncbi:MAG: TonB-dependent receptor [Pirellulaceae bacterium]